MQPVASYAAAEPPLALSHAEPPLAAYTAPCVAPLIIQVGQHQHTNVAVVQAQAHACSVPQIIRYPGARVAEVAEVIPAPPVQVRRHRHGFKPAKARRAPAALRARY